MPTKLYANLSTIYLYCGCYGDVPESAAVTLLDSGVQPNQDGSDWHDAIIVQSGDALYDAARNALSRAGKGTGFDYYLARRVGSGLGNDWSVAVSSPDGYQCWAQLTSAEEIWVGITDTAVEAA